MDEIHKGILKQIDESKSKADESMYRLATQVAIEIVQIKKQLDSIVEIQNLLDKRNSLMFDLLMSLNRTLYLAIVGFIFLYIFDFVIGIKF